MREPARRDRTTVGALTLAGLLAAGSTSPAAAGSVLDRVRAANTVSCGAEARPGFAEAGEDGKVTGLAVDLCRAIAVAVLGPAGKVVVTAVESDRDFDAVRDGRHDVAFLSGGTMIGERLAGGLLVGPPAYVETETVMVPESSAIAAPRDLAGKSVCFMIGTGAQRAMEAALDRDHVEVKRLGFQEDVELRDAYNVGRCAAVVAEATFLAEVRQDGGIHGLKSRILPDPLALDPVFLTTGLDDARWTAMATTVLQTLVLGSAPRSGWTGAGAGPLAEAATPLGFRPGWSATVTAEVGTYADLWRRNLGEGSALKLAAGPNTAWPTGLLMVPSSP